MFLINSLGGVDVAFFIIAGIGILLLVGLYFLIPLLNSKQYAAQRENLKKREIEFNANLQKNKELREAKIQAEIDKEKESSNKEEK